MAKSQLFQRASAQVTAFRSGIARQLSEIDGYYSGQSSGKEGREDGNEDCIEQLSDKDEVQKEGPGNSSTEDENECEMEEERLTHLNEKEQDEMSAVVHTHSKYAFVDESRKRTDEVTRGDNKQVHIEEVVSQV